MLKSIQKKIKIKDVAVEKENDLISSLFQTKKSPRQLAIDFQTKIKKKWKIKAPISKIEAVIKI